MAIKKPSVNITKPKASQSFATKEAIVKRLNERMASIVRNAGTRNEDYNRWATKLTRPGSPYATKTNTYDPDKIKLERNKGANRERTEFIQLSRKKADIEAMDLKDLERLEAQTRGWGAVKKEAKEALQEQRRSQDISDDNPFIDDIDAAEELEDVEITDADITEYLNQKEAVREFIEGNSDAFYALIEATGWDDIKEHTTEEIYQQIRDLNMGTYQFNSTLSEIGSDYIARRDASREHRRALGIL